MLVGCGVLREQVESTGTRATLASWAYDNPDPDFRGLGRLTSTTSSTTLGDFTATVGGYDKRGNPLATTFTYPGTLTGENTTGTASKTFTYGYNQLDQIVTTGYPDEPKLPATTVTTAYGNNGTFASMTTDDGRTIAKASYDIQDRPTSLLSQADANDPTRVDRSYTWTGDDRLDTLTATTGGSLAQLAYNYDYDALGNPVRITGTRKDSATAGTTAAWCYTYDGISRLTGRHHRTPRLRQRMHRRHLEHASHTRDWAQIRPDVQVRPRTPDQYR